MSHPLPPRHQPITHQVAATLPIRSRLARPTGVLAGCLVLAACGGPAARPPRVSATPPDTAALARTIPDILRTSGMPGLAMAVIDHGQVVWTGAFGNVTDPETIFEAASLSKPVFAYLVLRLVDRGELDLDRPLAELLEYPRAAGDPRYRRITGRMVLSHGSGFPNWGGERLTLAFDPGTAYGYSGEGFVYLQKVVEHITGRSLEQLARAEVFEPLGMRWSSYVWQKRFEGHAAASSRRPGRPISRRCANRVPVSGSGSGSGSRTGRAAGCSITAATTAAGSPAT
jgi:CubicO group peptidase (beta-lactamase class C family)